MAQRKIVIGILSVVGLLGVGIGSYLIMKGGTIGTPDIHVTSGTPTTTMPNKVLFLFPTGAIDNLDQSVLISFAAPMVPLKTLDEEADCPLTITPAANGKCRWISTQTVEFTPEQWKPATNYTIAVQGSGIQFTGNFSTPLLQWNVSQNESLRDGIQLIFNFPVKLDQLKEYLKVTNPEKKSVDIDIKDSQTPGTYIVQPKKGLWKYLTTYNFSISKALDAQDGNLPSTLKEISYTTPDSITSVDTLKAVKEGGNNGFESMYYNDETNGGGDNISTYTRDTIGEIYSTTARNKMLLPINNVAFDISFAETIPELSSNIIRLEKNGSLVSTSLSYVTENILDEETNTYKDIITKHRVRLTVKGSLDADSMYSLSYAPDGKEKISTRFFKTAPALKITRVLPMSYSKICLYTNNRLDPIIDAMTTSPTAKIQSVTLDESFYTNPLFNAIQIKASELDNFLTKNDLCPAPKQDEVVSIINSRLNPSSKYTLTFAPKDIYGNTVTPVKKEFTTEKMKDKDKFIYIGYPDKNTIPANLPLIVNIQSINSDDANIEVCTMDVEGYLNNKNNRNQGEENYTNDAYGYGDTPKQASTSPSNNTAGCSQYQNKTIKLKNTNWILSNTKIDAEKDILGTSSTQHIVRISGSIPSTDPIAQTRGFSSVFLRSNLSLMLEKGANKKVLLVTSFDGKPIADLTIEGYNRKQNSGNEGYDKVSIKATYDAKKGTYELSESADVLVASKGTYRGMLDSESDTTENYDFGYIAGYNSFEKEFLYLYTERPIYKPGDTVYFKGLFRKFNFDGFKKTTTDPGTLKIMNEQGEEIMSIPVTLDKNSNFNGSFVLPKDIDLGGFLIKYIKKDQSEIFTNAEFFVEEYTKPVFKVEVDSGTNDVIAGDNINISINPSYYFGGKITNTKGSYNVLSQKYYFDAKDYSDFQFGESNNYVNCIYRNECDYMDKLINIADSTFMIDKNGKYALNYKTTKEETEQLYTFTFEVKDPTTQRPVSKNVTKLIHATDGYVGLNLPYWNSQKQGIKMTAVTLNWDATPKANSPITLKLIKQDWKAIKKQGIDGVFYNDYSLEEVTESTESIKTNDKGILEKTLMPKTDGEYKIVVSYIGDKGEAFVSSQTVYVSGNDPLLWRTENNSVTKVVAEKTMVNVGDNAQYTIQSPINTGIIFVAIEKDDGILDYFTLPLTSYATKLTLPIKKEYYPNIYVKAFLLGTQKDNPLPVYKRGLAISKVNTLDQKLDVKITTNQELYLPGDKPEISVTVVDSKNKPVKNANLSIGIVDQSLLALKGNPVKNPFAYFYDMKRYLGIDTILSLNTLVEKLEIKDTSNGSKGGDGGSLKGGNSKKKRGVFKDTAYRNANVSTDAQGVAKITADVLPDNLTTWVIEALVNTDDTKVGVSTKTFQTALSIMINPNLPNMLSLDDTLVLHPVIFNKTKAEQIVSFTITGAYLDIKDAKQEIKIPAQSQIALDLDVTVNGKNIPYDTQLASKISMSATTKNPQVRDAVDVWVPVIQNASKETVTTVGNISSGAALEALDIPNDLQGSLTLSFSKSLFGSLLDGINMSSIGSYDCLEQRFSSFMPHVYTKNLYASAKKGDDYDLKKITIKQWVDGFDGYQDIPLDTYIKQQIQSIKKFQNTDGGFVFRYNGKTTQSSSVWLTNYVLSSMAELRNLGYDVPKDSATQAIKFLQGQFYKAQKICGNTKTTNPSCGWFVSQSMSSISAILDRDTKNKEAATMRELIAPLTIKTTNTTDALSKAILLGKLSAQKSSYKNDIAPIVAKVLNEELVMNPKTAYVGKHSAVSAILDTAYVLEASSYVPELIDKYSTIYDGLQRWIAEQKKDGSRGSTQTTSNVIKALTRFIAINPIAEDKMIISTSIGDKKLEAITLAKDMPFTIKTTKLNLADIDHDSKVNIKSDSNRKAFYDITMSYLVPAKDIAARYEGFIVKKEYYAYEDYMDIANKKAAERSKYINGKISYKALQYPKAITSYLQAVKDVKIGQVLVTNMTIVANEARDEVAIENFIPAGAELINPHLSTESKYAAQAAVNTQSAYGYGRTNMQAETSDEETNSSVLDAFVCDKEEFRSDRYFCYKQNLEPGVYTVTSLIRMTHAGTFAIKPTMVSEFYHPEIFGRTIGREIIVTK